MRLRQLSLRNKQIFDKYLALQEHGLSSFSFTNIYIWKKLYSIRWVLIEDSLCVFFQDKIGAFLYLPPLGKSFSPGIIKECFKIMDGFNRNQSISRIENIEESQLGAYHDLGYKIFDKPPEYLCHRNDLIELKGNNFKSKRACYNYFLKNYSYEYEPYASQYRKACLALYDHWADSRSVRMDALFQGMLKDSRKSLEVLLENYKELGVLGRIVKIDKEVKAFTFAAQLNKETACVIFEITDLGVRGLAQFIFRQFPAELTDYRYINIMDDSGLENLKKVKLSYRPRRIIPAYIATRYDPKAH